MEKFILLVLFCANLCLGYYHPFPAPTFPGLRAAAAARNYTVGNRFISLGRPYVDRSPQQSSRRPSPKEGHSESDSSCAAVQGRQSPIAIYDEDTFEVTLPAWNFVDFRKSQDTISVENTGETVKWTLLTENKPHVSGGGLPGLYKIIQFHLHWGTVSRFAKVTRGGTVGEGSEHTINGDRFAMEIHFVCHHSQFGSLSEAVASGLPHALTVLGVMVEVGTENAVMKELMPDFDDIHFEHSKTLLTPSADYNLRDILPEGDIGVNRFYRYEGSLTTEPYSEVIQWTVFEEPIQMSQEQLDHFSDLHSHLGGFIHANYRETQPLNGRILLKNNPVAAGKKKG